MACELNGGLTDGTYLQLTFANGNFWSPQLSQSLTSLICTSGGSFV